MSSPSRCPGPELLSKRWAVCTPAIRPVTCPTVPSVCGLAVQAWSDGARCPRHRRAAQHPQFYCPTSQSDEMETYFTGVNRQTAPTRGPTVCLWPVWCVWTRWDRLPRACAWPQTRLFRKTPPPVGLLVAKPDCPRGGNGARLPHSRCILAISSGSQAP